MSSDAGEDGRPGIEQGLVCRAWTMSMVVVALDRRSTIAFTFWKCDSSVSGAELSNWMEKRAQNYSNDFFHMPHKCWTSAEHIVGFQEKNFLMDVNTSYCFARIIFSMIH